MVSTRNADNSSHLPVAGENQRYFAKSIFVLLLLITTFVPVEIASVICATVIFISLFEANWNDKRGLISLIIPLFFLFILGTLGALRHPLYDAMKDVWYLAKVFFALGAGYLLMRYLRSFLQLCRLVVVVAVIAAMFHLLNVVLVIQSDFSIMDLRNEVGGGYFVTIVGLVFLVGFNQARQLIGFNKWSYYLSIALCAGSLMISGSRTNIISFAIMFLILRGWGKLNLKKFLTLAFFGALVTVVFFSGAFNNNQDETSLMGKFTRATTEVAISNYDNILDINLNWRGFESYRAYITYLDGSFTEKMFGQGFGAMVDLGFSMPLAGTEYQYIPVLHNGYMYVLVKYGLLGVLVYLYFILNLIRVDTHSISQQPIDLILAQRFITSLGWVFLFSTIVISGIFNKSVFNSSLIILGAAVAWRNMQLIRKGR